VQPRAVVSYPSVHKHTLSEIQHVNIIIRYYIFTGLSFGKQFVNIASKHKVLDGTYWIM